MLHKEEAKNLVSKAYNIDSKQNNQEYITTLISAVEKDPYFIEPYILMGFHYFKERNWSQAISNLKKCIELDYMLNNDNEQAEKIYVSLGKLYQITENNEKSLQSFKDFIGLFPDTDASLKLAKQIYSKLLSKDEWFFAYKKGYNFFKEGKYNIAVDTLKESAGLNKNFPWSFYYIGKSLVGLKKYDDGISYFNKAIELYEHFLFRYAIHEANEDLNDEQSSFFHLKKTIELNPCFPLKMLDIAEENRIKGNIKEAESILNKIVKASEEPYFIGTAREKLGGLSELGSTPSPQPENNSDSEYVAEKPEPLKTDTVTSEPDMRLALKNFKDKAEKILEEVVEKAILKFQEISSKIKFEDLPGDETLLLKLRNNAEDMFSEYVKRATKERFKIINDAEKQADEIVEKTEKETLEKKRKILKEANSEADEIIDEANRKAESIEAQIMKNIELKLNELSDKIRKQISEELSRVHK